MNERTTSETKYPVGDPLPTARGAAENLVAFSGKQVSCPAHVTAPVTQR